METKRHIFPLGMLLLVAASAGCSSQNDADVLFSDTDKAIIKTLIYTEPADDATNKYNQNSAAATLGQMFFWDTQFSGDVVVQGNRGSSFAISTTDGSAKKIACATCHVPSYGWADNSTKPNNVSIGSDFTSRNAPTILNAVRYSFLLWDGAVDTPWAVARVAIEGKPHNFHRYGVAYVICNSNSAAKGSYLSQYTAIFGAPDCTNVATAPGDTTNATGYGKTAYSSMTSAQKATIDTIFVNFSKAIAAYERLIVSKNSGFDQWANGSENAMNVSQKRGLKVFIGKGNCVRCHSGPNFSDGSFHNLGVPQPAGYANGLDNGRSDGITTLITGSNAVYNTSSSYNDSSATNRVSGLSSATSNVGQFKVPTLRSVSQTGPYFHNGTLNSLWDVVNFYNFAGNAGNFPGTKDTELTTRRMTNEDMEDLVNFLNALDGESLSTTFTTSTAPSTTSW